MVAGVRSNDLRLAAKSYATLHQRLLQLLDLLEVAVFATPSLLNGHSLSEGWSSGEADGKNSRSIPSGTSMSLPVCHPARSSTKRMRLLVPAPTSLAKCSKANEKTSTLTVGRRSASEPLQFWGAQRSRGSSTRNAGGPSQ